MLLVIDMGNTRGKWGLAHISHHPSTASADPFTVAGRPITTPGGGTSSGRPDVVPAMPTPSSSPCAPPQRGLDALVTKSDEKSGHASPGSTSLLRTGSFDMTCDMGTMLGYQDLPLASLKQVLISCVSSDICYRQAEAWLQANTPATVRRFTSRPQGFGVINGYQNPEQLGADRWAALLAARHIVNGRVLVADCGSAATLDLLDADGRHLGGYILPGLRMMRRALHRGSAGLPEVREGDVKIATNTADAIAAGTVLSIVSMIESAVARHKKPPCLLTGGDADVISRYLQVPSQHEPDLVLKGLVIAGSEPPDS